MTLPEHLKTKPLSYDTATDILTKPAHAAPSSVVVLKAPGRRLTKAFTKDGALPAENSRTFEYEAYTVEDLEDIEGLVAGLAGSPEEVVIRGAVVADAGDTIRRVVRRDRGTERSIVEAPRLWTMVDIDNLVAGYPGVPIRWQDHAEDVVRELIRHYLPPCFHDAGVVVSWSSSMGMQPAGGGYLVPKVHLFFLLNRPTWSIELANWLDPGKVDIAVFHPAQLHYTAAPTIEGGDPLGEHRVLRLAGPRVLVPVRIEPRASGSARARKTGGTIARGAACSWRARLEGWQDNRTENLHDMLRDAAWAYVNRRTNAGLEPSFEELQRCALETVLPKVSPERTQHVIENRFNDDLRRSFDSAVALNEAERKTEAEKLAIRRAKHLAAIADLTVKEPTDDGEARVGRHNQRPHPEHVNFLQRPEKIDFDALLLPNEGEVMDRYKFGYLGGHLSIDNGGTGSFKTSTMVAETRRILNEKPDARVLIVAPTHALAREIVSKLETEGLDAACWLGRGQTDDFDEPICKFHALATACRDAGGDPNKLCKSSNRTCGYAQTCLLFQQRQKRNVPAVQVATHQILHHPMAHRGPFDLVFIDEDVINTLVVEEKMNAIQVLSSPRMSVEALHKHSRDRKRKVGNNAKARNRIGPSGEFLHNVLVQLRQAIKNAYSAKDQDGRLLLKDLPSSPELLALRRTLDRMIARPSTQPLQTDERKTAKNLLKQLKSSGSANKPLLQAVKLLDMILRATANLKPGELYLPGSDVTMTADGNYSMAMSAVLPLHSSYSSAKAFVLLSATARPDLYEPLFKTVELSESPSRDRPAHSKYHLIPRSGSKTSLIDLESEKRKPKLLLYRVGDAIIATARKYQGAGTCEYDGYVVAQKEVKEQLMVYIKAKAPDVIQRLGFEHFYATAGLNRYERVRFGFIIGRPLPHLRSQRPRAEALLGLSLLKGTDGEYGYQTAANIESESWNTCLAAAPETRAGTSYRMAEPTSNNTYLDGFLHTACHAQVVQADRTRSNLRNDADPVDLYVMCRLDLCEFFEFDDVVQLNGLAGWFFDMAEHGIVPELEGTSKGVNQLIAAVLNDQFADACAVRKLRANRKQRHGEDDLWFIGTEGWDHKQRVTLRLPGERFASRALVNVSTLEEIEGFIGDLVQRGRLPEGTEFEHN